MNARLLFVHALTPLHPGTGQGVGAIDLPIARERATDLPYLPGSSLKGALRAVAPRGEQEPLWLAAFGPEPERASDHAGAVVFSDARLLFFPVRSILGTFAWTTSPLVLDRFVRDSREVGIEGTPPTPNLADAQSCVAGAALVEGRKVFLEELDLQNEGKSDWGAWFARQLFPNDPTWSKHFESRLCIVHDEVFAFLVRNATEVVARIRLGEDTKTVEKGALWYEEMLPAESVLAALVVATDVKRNGKTMPAGELLDFALAPKTLTLGGKASVGHGRCRLAPVVGGAK